jgi:hypothetical protein
MTKEPDWVGFAQSAISKIHRLECALNDCISLIEKGEENVPEEEWNRILDKAHEALSREIAL